MQLIDAEPLLPAEFGGSWSSFIADWCGGGELAHSPKAVASGLVTLHRLWPGYVERLVALPTRGLAPAAFAVDLGLLLDSCEHVAGFGRILQRLVSHGQIHDQPRLDRSAYSELVVVAMLHRCGYATEHEPPRGGKVLDACCRVGEDQVYFEVVSPDESQSSRADHRAVDAFSHAVQYALRACRVEIELQQIPDQTAAAELIDAAQHGAPNTWIEIPCVARLRRIQGATAAGQRE